MEKKVRIFYTVLGQKSLSMLHRSDSSMIWNSFIFDKYNKWLSYNIWFIYIQFYKVLFFFDFNNSYNESYLNFYLQKNFLIKNNSKKFKLSSKTPRFSYYIDLYCFEFLNQLILLNLYFYTTLVFYKNSKLRKTREMRKKFIEIKKEENFEKMSKKHINELDGYMYKTFF